MSRTPLIGVVGAEYWSYMAGIMATCLDRIARGGTYILPLGVFYDARKFFNVVLRKETGDTMFDNPPARQCAHALALEVLNSCDELRCQTEELANYYFQEFDALLEKLSRKRVKTLLSPRELEIAKELQKFFTALHQLGTKNTRI